MQAEVTIEAHYPGDTDTIFAQATSFAELTQAMKGAIAYSGLPEGRVTKGATYRLDLTIWGLLKVRNHQIFIENLDIANRRIQSREQNPMARRWDHTLSVQPGGPGCIWTDSVIIDAGLLTSIVARFAAYMYTRRHRYRQAAQITRSQSYD